MKKIFLLLMLAATCACNKTYTEKVYEENGVLGNITNENIIKAKDDFDGYFQGAAYYISFKQLIEASKHGMVTGFDVYDENGVNLKYKLNKHRIDSIMNLANKNLPVSVMDTSTSK